MASLLLLVLLGSFLPVFRGEISPSDPAFLYFCPGDSAASDLAHFGREIGAEMDLRPASVGIGAEVFVSMEMQGRFAERFPQAELLEKAQPLRQKLANSNLPDGYLDLAGIWAKVDSLVKDYPNLIRKVDLTSYGPGRTYEKREMPMVKISDNVGEDEDETNVYIVASHHSREIINPHIALDLMERLLKGYQANDTRVVRIVEENELFISPLWNPDGYHHVWESNNMWRKNRKPISGSTYGVDQNRNYPYGWDKSCSGSSVPSSETYKGPTPGSEEETQIIMAFSRQRNFAKVNDFHSSGREVLYSFVCEEFPQALDRYLFQEATTLAGQTEGITYRTRYPSGDGQHQEFHLKEETGYAFLTETQTQFQPPYADALREMDALWPLNLYFLEKPVPYSARVVSASGRPVEADLSIRGMESVFWKSNARFGRFNLYLPDGTYTVTFSAPGFQNSTQTLFVSNSNPVRGPDVVLK